MHVMLDQWRPTVFNQLVDALAEFWQTIPVEEQWHVGIKGTENGPDEYRVGHGERLLRDVGEDHAADLMSKLQAPRAQEWHE